MIAANLRAPAALLACLAHLAAAQSSVEFPPVEGGSGIYTLPVEPPLTDVSSIVQITIITPTFSTISVTSPVPGTPSTSLASGVPIPLPTPLPSTTASTPSNGTITTSTTTATVPPSDGEDEDAETTSSPNPGATMTAFLNQAAGVALAAAIGFGMAM